MLVRKAGPAPKNSLAPLFSFPSMPDSLPATKAFILCGPVAPQLWLSEGSCPLGPVSSQTEKADAAKPTPILKLLAMSPIPPHHDPRSHGALAPKSMQLGHAAANIPGAAEESCPQQVLAPSCLQGDWNGPMALSWGRSTGHTGHVPSSNRLRGSACNGLTLWLLIHTHRTHQC